MKNFFIKFLDLEYPHFFFCFSFQGTCGTVTGHWDVDFDEASCVTWWRGYDDKVVISSTIYFNFRYSLMATTGLRRTRNSCSSSCYQSYLVHVTYINKKNLQRYESVLENLQWGDDWHVMCATTPGRVHGRVFNGPSSCASWVS